MYLKPIVAICAIIVALTSVVGLMQMGEDWEEMHVPVTDTQAWLTAGWKGGGLHPDIPGEVSGRGELFQATQIFTSFDASDNSETLVVGGMVELDDISYACTISKTMYVFHIWDGTGDITLKAHDDPAVDGWSVLATDDVPAGKVVREVSWGLVDELYAQAFAFKLDGLYVDGATIQVRFEVYCEDTWFWNVLVHSKGWRLMAVDEARLIRGDGDLIWGADRYTVGVDTNAKLSWFVPGIMSEVEDSPVYTIYVTNENTGRIIYEVTVESKSGIINIPITDDMAEEGGENRLKARLWNNIFQKDVTHVTVRIIGGFYAPGDDPLTDEDFPVLNSITMDEAEYREGDLATVTISATAGRYPISHYYLLCEIEGTVVFDAETSKSVVQMQVSIAGILECEGSVYDIYGNPSVVRKVKATVTSQVLADWCLLHPDDPACKVTEEPIGINWFESIILAIAMVALLLIIGVEGWVLFQVGLTDWRILLGVIGGTLIVGLIVIGMLFVSFSINGLAAPVMPWDTWGLMK